MPFSYFNFKGSFISMDGQSLRQFRTMPSNLDPSAINLLHQNKTKLDMLLINHSPNKSATPVKSEYWPN